MTLHDDLMGRNIACDAVDCAKTNGSGVRAHEHFDENDKDDPYLSPLLSGWRLDVDGKDFCPECLDKSP